jgi:hypothetical protein
MKDVLLELPDILLLSIEPEPSLLMNLWPSTGFSNEEGMGLILLGFPIPPPSIVVSEHLMEEIPFREPPPSQLSLSMNLSSSSYHSFVGYSEWESIAMSAF